MKRDLYKETNMYKKRPIYRDTYRGKIHEKRSQHDTQK